MEKAIIFLSVILFGSNVIFAEDIGVSNRISNGQEVPIGAYNYTVSIQLVAQSGQPTRGHICGGAAITLQHVLSAAFCAYRIVNQSYVLIPASELRVFAGASVLTADNDPNRTIRSVANYTVHGEYILPPASVNDIAVFTLVAPYSDATIKPLPLPTSDFVPADFTLCTIASWGARFPNETASNSLRLTTKYIYNQGLCKTIYNTQPMQLNVLPLMICAASFDIISSGCNGDIGIPLVCTGGLAGILFKTNACTATSYPEVYTQVANYTTWIRTISGAQSFRPELTLFAVLAVVINKVVNLV